MTFKESSHLTWKMRRSLVMMEVRTTFLIQKYVHQTFGQFLLQKSQVQHSSKTTFEDEGSTSWSSRPAHHTMTPKCCRELLSRVEYGFSSGRQQTGWNSATRNCQWASCSIPASEQNRQARNIAFASRGKAACPLCAVFYILSSGEH